MKYEQPTFTTPVSNGKMSDYEYEVKVGIRCSGCGEKECKCHPSDCHCDGCYKGVVNYWIG